MVEARQRHRGRRQGARRPGEFGTPAKGGTFRIGVTDIAQSDNLDPTGEYFGTDFTIYSSLLLRRLVSFRLTAGQAGNELVPDLATEIPAPTDGGLKYTFTLKDGVKFGPPVNRAVSSKDIAYAIERIGTPSLVAQYPGTHEVIKGFNEFAAGKAKTISGIQTPDDKTISFTLTQPTGDFLFRLALPRRPRSRPRWPSATRRRASTAAS